MARADSFLIPAGTQREFSPALHLPATFDGPDSWRERAVELAASNRALRIDLEAVNELLKKSKHRCSRLLDESGRLRNQLRLRSRQILLEQEEERKRISRELHDVVDQALTIINLRLEGLRKQATLTSNGLKRSIAVVQREVQRSVDIVHRFARGLRPLALDDLGLISALHTFMKGFREETGIHASLTAFAAVEQVSDDKRTVLYRVAQEALNNVARHAQASWVEVSMHKVDDAICLRISDNGRGFSAKRVLHAKKPKRLGLLGMKERLEIVDGTLTIESVPGQGTTIQAQIPL